MTLIKKYLDSIILVALCLVYSDAFTQNQEKKYYAFDGMATILTLSNGNVELSSNGQVAKGKYWVIENELHLMDTFFNVKSLYMESRVSYDSTISLGRTKLRINRHFFFTPSLTSYRNGSIDNFQTINDSIIYLESGVDSFYLSFLGLDVKSCVFMVDNAKVNVIDFTVPNKILNSLSLGNEIAYILMEGDKINLHYYLNGRMEKKYVYTSKKALLRDKQNRLKEFKKTGYWNE